MNVVNVHSLMNSVAFEQIISVQSMKSVYQKESMNKNYKYKKNLYDV